MKGQDVIDFIKKNKLEDAVVTVTATMYYNGDHDCRTTDEVDLMQSSHFYDGKYRDSINFYVDDELY